MLAFCNTKPKLVKKLRFYEALQPCAQQYEEIPGPSTYQSIILKTANDTDIAHSRPYSLRLPRPPNGRHAAFLALEKKSIADESRARPAVQLSFRRPEQ